MVKVIVKAMRVGVIVFWLVFALSLASVIPPPVGPVMIWLGAFVLAAHLAEYLYARSALAEPERARISLVRTMLFGFTHLLPLFNNRREMP